VPSLGKERWTLTPGRGPPEGNLSGRMMDIKTGLRQLVPILQLDIKMDSHVSSVLRKRKGRVEF